MQIATFNVNGRPPPPQVDLSQWLRADAEADVLAVGFQEIVPLSAGNVVMGASAHQGRMHVCDTHESKPDSGLRGTPAICNDQASNVDVSSYEPLIIQDALMRCWSLPVPSQVSMLLLTGANLEAAAVWDALIRRALMDTTADLEYQQVHDSLLDGCLSHECSAHESVVAEQNP